MRYLLIAFAIMAAMVLYTGIRLVIESYRAERENMKAISRRFGG